MIGGEDNVMSKADRRYEVYVQTCRRRQDGAGTGNRCGMVWLMLRILNFCSVHRTRNFGIWQGRHSPTFFPLSSLVLNVTVTNTES